MIAMNVQRKQVAAYKTCKINDEVVNTTDITFKIGAENIQREHIEDKMHPVYVKETGSNQTFIIFVKRDLFNFKRIAGEEFVIVEPSVRNNNIQNDNGNAY